MSRLIKLARKFELKLAQEKSFIDELLKSLPEPAGDSQPADEVVNDGQKAEMNEKIRQMIEGPEGPDRDMGIAMKDWMAKHPTFTESQIDGAADQWQREHIVAPAVDPEEVHKKKLWKEFCIQRGIKKGDPYTQEIWNEWAEVQKADNKIQEMQAGFDAQDKEVQDFMDKEHTDKLNRQKNIEGKTPFSIQDATVIINSELNSIKIYTQKALKRKLVGDQKVIFVFYPNGNVGIVGQDIAMVNAIRRGFATPLQLAVRSFCTMHKKYFTGEIKYEMAL